jgi:pimeloyl-ACP methyl ester carboxylesterase
MPKKQSTDDFHVSHVEHAGARLVVRTIGSETRPALVMLPSLGRSGRDFDDLARLLAEHDFRIILPEPRGIGGSTGTYPEGTTLHHLAADIGKAVIPHFAERPVTLIGHAFGNRVARTVAADFPNIVSSLVLIAAGGIIPIPPAILEGLRGSMELSLPKEQRLGHLRTAFFAPGNDPSVWLDGWWPDIAAGQSAAVRATPVEDWWEAGGKKITVLQGEHDTIAPRSNAEDLQKRLGDRVRIIDIKNAGHALLPEQPEQIAQALLSLLSN